MKRHASSMWAAVDHARTRIDDSDCPKDSFTVAEYMEHYGVQRRAAEQQLIKAVRARRLATGYKSTLDSAGRMIRAKCFWPIRKGSKS
jgi:hypothetical protein